MLTTPLFCSVVNRLHGRDGPVALSSRLLESSGVGNWSRAPAAAVLSDGQRQEGVLALVRGTHVRGGRGEETAQTAALVGRWKSGEPQGQGLAQSGLEADGPSGRPAASRPTPGADAVAGGLRGGTAHGAGEHTWPSWG